MIARFPPFLLACAAPLLVSAQEGRSLDGTRWAQLTIRERIVIRIPRVRPVTDASVRSLSALPAAATPLYVERRAPDCVPAAALTGASVDRSGAVDLLVGDGRRLRAKLEDECPTLDFYSGFYLKRSADGQVCAKRDSLRSRSGAHCAIKGFKTLIARR